MCERQWEMPEYAPNNDNSCFNITPSNYVWNNSTVTDDRSSLLALLSDLKPGLQHEHIQEGRVNGVGEWFIQTEEFRRWSGFDGEGGGDETVLFGYGDPGVGKTFIR